MSENVTLEKGSQVRFIELDQHNVVKRFIVPEIESLESRVQGFIKKYPNISLVRIGRAIVTSKDETNPLKDGLLGVPSGVDDSYTVDLCGDHPVLVHGPARYSTDLIIEIATAPFQQTQEERIEQGQLSVYDFSSKQETPVAGVDLAAQLRQQLAQQALNAKVEEKKESLPAKSELEIIRKEDTPSTIILPKNVSIQKEEAPIKSLDEAMAEAKAQRLAKAEEMYQKRQSSSKVKESKVSTTFTPQVPQSKLDIILEKVSSIESILTFGLASEGEEVTGPELEEWFYEHLDTIGHHKTFAILASRLKR